MDDTYFQGKKIIVKEMLKMIRQLFRRKLRMETIWVEPWQSNTTKSMKEEMLYLNVWFKVLGIKRGYDSLNTITLPQCAKKKKEIS